MAPAVVSAPYGELILHWEGRAWKNVPAPSIGGSDLLTAVAASSARSIWAVGDYTVSGSLELLAVHCC